jgi:hypothetical protein
MPYKTTINTTPHLNVEITKKTQEKLDPYENHLFLFKEEKKRYKGDDSKPKII